MQGMALRERGEVGGYNGSGGGGVYFEGNDDMGVRSGSHIFPIFHRTHKRLKRSQVNFQFSNMMRSASGQSQVEANGDVVLVPWGYQEEKRERKEGGGFPASSVARLDEGTHGAVSFLLRLRGSDKSISCEFIFVSEAVNMDSEEDESPLQSAGE